jgi:hypothetical protein
MGMAVHTHITNATMTGKCETWGPIPMRVLKTSASSCSSVTEAELWDVVHAHLWSEVCDCGMKLRGWNGARRQS